MIKLVAFDWNGTILSDTNAVVRAESAVRMHFGLPPTDLKEFQNQYTIPIRNYWISAGFPPNLFDEKAAEIQEVFLHHYEPEEKLCRTRSGAKELLKWLKENNIDSVIFSNHPEAHIRVQLKRLKISEYFSEVLGRESQNSHMHKRSKAGKLKTYVTSHKFEPTEVITVGDTDEEIEIAHEQGFTSIALTAGYQSTLRLKSAKPHYLINNLKGLAIIIQNINNHGRVT
jgi:phosphoglycolate phosphatase